MNTKLLPIQRNPSIRFHVLTLFPDIISLYCTTSIIGRASKKNIIRVNPINIRDFAVDSYGTVDGKPYGGGTGMILRVDVLYKALRKAIQSYRVHASKRRIILLDPKGQTFTEHHANRLSTYKHIICICGHYEGVDERIRSYVDEVISVGDYIVSGGELPALTIIDSICRLKKGVLRSPSSFKEETFTLTSNAKSDTVHEYPQYTKPKLFRNKSVPEILFQGNHGLIEEWKKQNIKTFNK
jgi:tRNA (guanine37-N1)-methyltransferase